MITIDGSYGEGGGQIVRTALALSSITGKAVEIINVRANRQKPGLQPQHLTGVLACAQIAKAEIEGATLNATRLAFSPRQIKGGEYVFDVEQTIGRGSAGSVALILQAVLLPLCRADSPSHLILRGGTHVSRSPSFQYLDEVFLPMVRTMGVQAELDLVRWGFYPIGKGEVIARVTPVPRLTPLSLEEPGELKRISGISAVANLPLSIAERQQHAALALLKSAGIAGDIRLLSAPAVGRGTACFLKAEVEHGAAGFCSLGAIGKRAETVGHEAAQECLDFLKTGTAVDKHLADQLLPYLALAEGPSSVTTEEVTSHLLTNLWVIGHFVEREVRVEGALGERGRLILE